MHDCLSRGMLGLGLPKVWKHIFPFPFVSEVCRQIQTSLPDTLLDELSKKKKKKKRDKLSQLDCQSPHHCITGDFWLQVFVFVFVLISNSKSRALKVLTLGPTYVHVFKKILIDQGLISPEFGLLHGSTSSQIP